MPKDYAKSHARAKPAKDKSKRSRRWLMLLTPVLLIGFIVGLTLLKLKHPQPPLSRGAPIVDRSQEYVTPMAMPTPQATPQPKPIPSKPIKQNSPLEPTFDFYQALPEGDSGDTPQHHQQVIINKEPPLRQQITVTKKPLQQPKKLNRTSSTTQKPNTTNSKQHKSPAHYYIQLASFSRYREADNLKGRLILDGYQPVIAKSTIRHKTWYRVILGPFDSNRAHKINTQLIAQGLHGLIRRR